ncbi:hypothetical protein FRUB_04641 [Fimbriiglobus ruber]|uniref:Uncharacterized protein n=1 Tax=Fimbriiglobus ruber TaxID=1908690 RepID=A0A225DRN5_9BACT|nr:hypothetical protein FRUB_04641 [Fimbriiglobus ruber]
MHTSRFAGNGCSSFSRLVMPSFDRSRFVYGRAAGVRYLSHQSRRPACSLDHPELDLVTPSSGTGLVEAAAGGQDNVHALR